MERDARDHLINLTNIHMIEIEKPRIPRKACDNHDVAWPLMGLPCPRCKRLSLFAYDYGV